MEISKRKVMTGKKFLTFILADENFCIEIIQVKELKGLSNVTHIPHTPDYIKGVMNLRGQIIPIIDLRIKFGFEQKTYDKRTSVIVVELDYEGEILLIGLVVDLITEVIGINKENIKKLPYINAKIKSEFIKGVANVEEGIIVVLDINKVLNEDEFVLLKNIDDIKANT